MPENKPVPHRPNVEPMVGHRLRWPDIGSTWVDFLCLLENACKLARSACTAPPPPHDVR